MLGLFKVPRRMEDLALFTRHVAGAMNTRAPLPEMLRAYVLDSEESELGKTVLEIASRVESGVELSSAMEEYPLIFPAAYRRLVRLGEQGKTLGGVMAQLADSLDESLKTFEYFRRAAVYPLFIMVLLFLDIIFILIKISPKFGNIYDQLGFNMPGLLANPGSFMNGVVLFMALLTLIAIGFLLATFLGLRLRGVSYGRTLLQMPLVGPVLRRAETARFANNLALLLQNRLPLAESLGLLADSTDNGYVRDAIQDFHQRYQTGERLGDMMAAQPLFPASMAVMIASAEDQGGLAETLRGLGKYYAERTSHGLVILREVFEPLLLLMIGLFLAVVLVALYSPLFNIAHYMSVPFVQ